MSKHGHGRDSGHRFGKSGDGRRDRFADGADEKPRRARHAPYDRARDRRLDFNDAGWDSDTSV